MKRRFDLTYEERCVIKDKIMSSNEGEYQQAQILVLNKLEHYIYSIVKKHFAGFEEHLEDFLQCGKMAVIEHLTEYTPNYTLATFFNFHIQNAMQDLANNINGETHYYAQNGHAIRKAIRQLGMSQDSIDYSALAGYMSQSENRVKNVVSQTLNKQFIELIEEDSDNLVDEFKTPEYEIIDKERRDIIMGCINKLPLRERALIILRQGLQDDRWNPFAKTYKFISIQKIFDYLAKSGYESFDANVPALYTVAMRHLTDRLIDTGYITQKNKYYRTKDKDFSITFTNKEDFNNSLDALDSI